MPTEKPPSDEAMNNQDARNVVADWLVETKDETVVESEDLLGLARAIDAHAHAAVNAAMDEAIAKIVSAENSYKGTGMVRIGLRGGLGEAVEILESMKKGAGWYVYRTSMLLL